MLLDQLRVAPRSRVPISTQLSSQLAWLIASGSLAVGQELPPATKIAAALDVNAHTVRAAFRHLSSDGLLDVSRGRRARVVSAIGHHDGRSDRPPTNTIGVLLPNYGDYYTGFLRGLNGNGQGSELLCWSADSHGYDELTTRRWLQQFATRDVEGITAIHVPDPESEVGRMIAETPCPVVFADTPGAPGASVEFDREYGAREAGQHLLDHGHRHFAVITGPGQGATARTALRGFLAVLEEAGVAASEVPVVAAAAHSAESGAEATERLLDSGQQVTAVFCIGDGLAIGGMDTLRSRSIRVPQDAAVVGLGDNPTSRWLNPRLTTIELRSDHLGVETRRLVRMLRADPMAHPERVILPTRLVVRESCGCQS